MVSHASSSEKVPFQDVIAFFKKKPGQTEEYLDKKDIVIEKTDCGWMFRVPATDKPQILGIMIPTGSLDVVIGVTPLDLYKSKRYYYAPSRELERLLRLNAHDFNALESPIVHMIDNDKAFAWSCPNECLVSCFVHQYKWCINFEAITWGDHVTFFLDESINSLINLQRYPHRSKKVLINETTSLKSMQKALLTGAQPRRHPNHPHDFIRKARQIQLELSKRDLDSVIIGSLARRLNSVPVDINDIDLMVEDKDKLHRAIDVIESFTDRITLHDTHAKFKHEDCTIDICYDNYNILAGSNHIINQHGLTYLGAEGLLWLYMINLFACESGEHSDDYKDYVNNAIVSLCKTQTGEFDIIPHGKTIPDYSKKCSELCLLLSEGQMEYRDIRINKPFLVRSFRKEDEFFYVIVNQGSCCDAELVIDQTPTTVTWQDISGETKIITPIPGQSFSIAHIPQIYLPGVVRCQKSQ